jgi:signal transduction histidine kinase
MDKTTSEQQLPFGTAALSGLTFLRALILEDNPADVELSVKELIKAGFELQFDVVDSEEAFLAKLHSQSYDVILADYRIPSWNGGEAFRRLKQSGEDVPFILVTGAIGEETAVELIKEGIADYILKDRLVRLPSAVRRALQEKMIGEERERALQSLRQSEERVRSLLKELEQFLYVGSHDLQEPVRMVVSYTELLSKRYKGKLDADADQFIAFAVDGASRMQGLIQGLLAYSRVVTRGKDLLDTSSEGALQQAVVNLRSVIEESRAQVTHDSLPRVLADDAQLTQVFQNLIENAIKYRSPGIPKAHVGASRSGGKWIFSVQDNGMGIDSQYFERIFGMFQRLHKREEFGGTGVGLAICKKIVERHGGAISVESQPGVGSTFRFALMGN